MYMNAGYLNSSRTPFKDKSKPLIVTCCGTYRLKTKERLPTRRPRGSLDYQLIYVASGKTHFYFHGEERIVNAEQMVLFQPRQEQHYEYFASDKPEVYWIHFTGGDVKNILRHFNIPLDEPVFYSGNSSTYAYLFKEIIHELQSCRVGYQELLEMYLKQILLLIERSREERKPTVSSFIQDELELARRYFTEHYNEDINIEEYAKSRGMSFSWFSRNFKQLTAKSPMQYVVSVRINNAASLLGCSSYNINEVSNIVGYDNPLYFSRIFKKVKGVSPSEYKKSLLGQTETTEDSLSELE